jgi:Tfp pilus assembly protein PilV
MLIRVIRQANGYTLMETLIAFSVLMVGVVPLLQASFTAKQNISAQYKITASCLCEQEAAQVKSFPQQAVPIKRRKVAGKEWLIKTDVSGAVLKSYNISAELNGRTWGSLFFYQGE